MATAALAKIGLYQTIESLPPKSLDELALFLDFLAHKYQVVQHDVVILGGLWKEVDFDVDDRDVRSLRHDVTDQLLGKL